MQFKIPQKFNNKEELDQFLSLPYPETVELMKRLDGDIIVLGAGGKMGPSLVRTALRACEEANASKKIISVDLFNDSQVRKELESVGSHTIVCDLSDPYQVKELPLTKNVIHMAGRKFGQVGTEPLTWMLNVVVPGNVVRHFKKSKMVAFSTGCIYPLVSPDSKGSSEKDAPMPVGEYASSCLGRERIFEYCAQECGTEILLYRLNYSVECRYGVLVDIAQKVYSGEPVDRSVAAVNFIWQGDAVNRAILCLDYVSNPAVPLNVTGDRILKLEDLANELGRLLGKSVTFTGEDSGKAYLSDATRSVELFGEPRVSSTQMIKWVVDWIQSGKELFGKPTHFQVTDGQYLDEKK